MHDQIVYLFVCVLECSVQAVLLLAIIWIVQRLFGKRLTTFWKWCLWSVFILRLIIPFSFSANLIDFGGFKSSTSVSSVFQNSTSPIESTILEYAAGDSGDDLRPLPVDLKEFKKKALFWCAIFYSTVVFILFLMMILGNRRLAFRLRRTSLPVPARLVTQLEECKYIANVSNYVGIIVSPLVGAPALTGFRQPMILIPPSMAEKVSDKELRYILFHELTHIRNRDIPLTYLMNSLRIIHWFNPVIAAAFSLIRNEREILCDELVLEITGERTARDYGSTILKMLEISLDSRAISSWVGILDSGKHLKQRILRIRDYRKISLSAKMRWAAGMLVSLVLVFGFTSLVKAELINADLYRTEAKEGKKKQSFFAERFLPQKHGHMINVYSGSKLSIRDRSYLYADYDDLKEEKVNSPCIK